MIREPRSEEGTAARVMSETPVSPSGEIRQPHRPLGQDVDGRHFDCEVCGGAWPCASIKAEWRAVARRVMFKYPLALASGPQPVEMPAVADIKHVHEQQGRPAIWAEVNTSAPTVTRTFYVYATGEDIDMEARHHLGTIHVDWTVWHVYEGVPNGGSLEGPEEA